MNVTAPDLADLLTDPEGLAELLEHYRRHLADTPLADQLAAATVDAEQVMRRLPGTVHETPVAAVPDPVLVGCLDQLLAWSAGRSSTCLHSPHPDPRPDHGRRTIGEHHG